MSTARAGEELQFPNRQVCSPVCGSLFCLYVHSQPSQSRGHLAEFRSLDHIRSSLLFRELIELPGVLFQTLKHPTQSWSTLFDFHFFYVFLFQLGKSCSLSPLFWTHKAWRMSEKIDKPVYIFLFLIFTCFSL